MKRISHIAAFVAALAAVSCQEQEIPVYRTEDSAVFFGSKGFDYSLKGITDPEYDVDIELQLFGTICDYDREVSVEVADSSYNDAVEGRDFEIVSALVPAGATKGRITLRLANGADLESHTVALALVPGEAFSRSVKGSSSARIHWSKEYVRPSNQHAWKSWWYFFCHGYSRSYHELLLKEFGDEIEHSGYDTAAMKDENTTYHVLSWWYSASRQFYAMVKEHDEANPDSPYMHSDDYETYTSYLVAAGEGESPEAAPTILSTLIAY